MTAHKEGSDKISRDLAPPVARGAERPGTQEKDTARRWLLSLRLL